MSLFRLNTNNHITSMIIAGSLSIILYLISGALLLLKLNSQPLAAGLSRFQLLLPAVIAVLLHGWLVYQGLLTPQGLDIGFFSVWYYCSWRLSANQLKVLVFLSFRWPP